MRIFVTGISGYIGTQLTAHLDGDDEVEAIIGLDVAAPRAVSDKLVFIERSVTAPFDEVLRQQGADAAVHLAFALDPLRDAGKQRRINVDGTANFLRACASSGVRDVTVASSATAYGAHPDNPVPLLESHPVRAVPAFPYAYEKVVLEQLTAAFAHEHPEVAVKVVRPAIVCGPNVANFISRSLTRQLMPLVSGYDPLYQLVYEEDVGRAFYVIVRHGAPGPYNVAPDDWAPISELAQIAGSRPLWLPYPLARAVAEIGWRAGIDAITEAQPGLIDFIMYPWVIRPRRLVEELGFAFSKTTRDTLKSFLAAEKNPATAAAAGP